MKIKPKVTDVAGDTEPCDACFGTILKSFAGRRCLECYAHISGRHMRRFINKLTFYQRSGNSRSRRFFGRHPDLLGRC